MKKIVIAEDDQGVQDGLRIIFKNTGYEAMILPDGNAITNGDIEKPDLYLIDKHLPGTDGLDVCRCIKSKADTKDVPVIMILANQAIEKLAGEAGEMAL
jgi:DNA-binding response OmpR family regulator